MRDRLVILVGLLLIAGLVLAGCATRAGVGEAAAMAEPDEMVIDLPAIVIDFDSEGNASIGGVPVAELGQTMGADLSTLRMDPGWVRYFTETNIQHIQINNTPSGLQLLVNGQPIPSLKWDENRLVATADIMSRLGVVQPVVNKVMPLVDNLGVGVILRFPVKAGMAVIPFIVEGDETAAAEAARMREEFLAAVGAPPTIQLPIFYNEDGSFSVGDLTDVEWQAVTGTPLTALRLQPQAIQAMSQLGIQSLGFRTDENGVHISINGQDLPYVSWAQGEALYLVDLIQQTGLLDAYLGGALPVATDMLVTTLEQLLPVVQASKANLIVYFP